MHQTHRARRKPALALAAGLLSFSLLAAACGGDDGGDSADTTAAAETTAGGADTTAGGSDTTAGGSDTTAAAETTAPAAEAKPGGTLRVRVEADTNGWVPAIMQCDSACQIRARTFFEPLMSLDNDLNLAGHLAEGIEPNDTFDVWTLTLREGISFHDGTPFNADAVVTSLQRAAVTGFIGQAFSDIEGGGPGKDPAGVAVKKIDDTTVEITTSRPWTSFPYYLAAQGAFQASPTWYAKVFADPAAPDATVGAQPVGTGPFVFDSWKPGDVLVVKKNPNYWQQDEAGNALPYLDGIEFKVIADELTAANALEAGQIDFMPTDNGENIKKFGEESEGGTKWYFDTQEEYGETNYQLMHVGKEGSDLADRNFRCGLAAATDQETLAAAIGAGVFPVANGVFSPGQQGFLEDTGYQSFDMDKAKEYIQAFKDANGGRAPKLILSTVTDQTALNAANLNAQNYKDAGAEVEVTQIEQQKIILNALLGDPAFDMFAWRNHAGIVLDNQYIWWHSKYAAPSGQLALNFGRLRDPVIDEALDSAREAPEPADQVAFAEEVNKQMAAECWVIPTTWTIWGLVGKPEVKGIGQAQHPAGGILRDGAGFPGQVWFSNVWLDQ